MEMVDMNSLELLIYPFKSDLPYYTVMFKYNINSK